MRRFTILIPILFLSIQQIDVLKGQQVDSVFIEQENTYSTAFALFNKEPNTIIEPQSPKDFSIEWINDAASGSLNFNNLGIILSPYWLSSLSDDISDSSYYHSGFPETILQTLTVSLVNSRNAENDYNSLGAGINFNLISGRFPNSLSFKRDSLSAIQDSINATDDISQITDIINESKRIAAEIENMDRNREGLIIQVSGAIRGDYPNNSFEKGVISKTGVWSTLAYRTNNIDFLALCRYLRFNEDENPHYFDTGVRLLYNRSKLKLSTEYVYRYNGYVNAAKNYRFTGCATYALTDNLSIGFTFGKNFEPETVSEGDLVAQLNISFGSMVKELWKTGEDS